MLRALSSGPLSRPSRDLLPRPAVHAPAREPARARRLPDPLLQLARPRPPDTVAEAARPAHRRAGRPNAHVVAPPAATPSTSATTPGRRGPSRRARIRLRAGSLGEGGGGILYVETAHSTYAKSSYGLNAYLNAVDLKTKKLRWRSPALVANADNFVLLNGVIVSGMGLPPNRITSTRSTAPPGACGRVLLPTGAGADRAPRQHAHRRYLRPSARHPRREH